jgi:hypothetical protein
MTTNREIKKLFAPILERHDDLALVKIDRRLTLVVKPVHHLLRGVHIESTSEAVRFDPWWFTSPLFSPIAELRLVGNSLYPGRDIRLWDWHVLQSIQRFYDILETEILPRLRVCLCPSDIMKLGRRFYHMASENFDAHGFDFLALLAEGRIADAVVSLDEFYETNRFVRRLDGELAGMARLLARDGDALRSADRLRIASLFHAWERRQVDDYGIKHLWEETPFGIEAGL